MLRYFIIPVIALCTLLSANAQSDAYISFVIENLEGVQEELIMYPLGSTYKTWQTKKIKETVKTPSSIVYTGDIRLFIYPKYSKRKADIHEIVGKRLRIVYYTELPIEASEEVLAKAAPQADWESFETARESEVEDELVLSEENATQESTERNQQKDVSLKTLDVQLYPNPATTQLFIDVEATEGENIQVVLVNQSGQLVLQERFEEDFGQRIALNVQAVPKGVYTVQIKTAGVQMASKQVLIGL